MLIRQAIVTKFIGPSNSKGSRVKAKAAAGSITLHWDHSLSVADNDAKAAKALAEKFGWKGHWVAGGMPDGTGSVFVSVETGGTGSCGFEPAFVVEG